jgi:hypothetical protein
MSFFKKISKVHFIVLASIIVLFVAVRIALPYIVKNYVNKELADMGTYTGQVEDIDIHLIRGAYVINGLKIDKKGGKVPVPFLIAPKIDLSVEWKALLKGSVKAKVIFKEAVLTFVAGPTKETSQTGEGTDWTKPLHKLLPIEINKLEIHDGRINYNDFHSTPKVDMFIKDLELVATNLSNVENKNQPLPSDLTINGTSIGGGNLSLTGKINVLKQVPDADIKMKFININLTGINNLATAYGKFDFERGKMDVFSEMTLKNNGKVDGYVKPILMNVKILNWQEDKNFSQQMWQAAVGLTFEAFKNHPKDQFATKIPIEGNINTKIDTDIFTTIIRVLRNGFVEAYKKTLDNSVSFSGGNKDEVKDKKFLFFKIKK